MPLKTMFGQWYKSVVVDEILEQNVLQCLHIDLVLSIAFLGALLSTRTKHFLQYGYETRSTHLSRMLSA